jgi:hypothetical protein
MSNSENEQRVNLHGETMQIRKLLIAMSLLLPLPSLQSFGQQAPPESCDVPVVVTRFDTSFQELSAKDFLVHLGTIPVTMEGATVDRSPKRVALILDASRYVPDNEWKVETEIAADLVGHARPFDSFAVIIVAGENATQGFLPPAEIREQLRGLWTSRPSRIDSSERVFDALSAAAKLLDPPQFGDSLVLFGHMNDVDSKTDPDRLQGVIMRNKLRVLGFDFSDPLPTPLPPGFDPNNIPPESSGPQKLEKMTTETGYYFSFDAMEGLNRPGQMRLFESFLGDLYRRISEPYRLRARAFASRNRVKLEITVANSEVRKIRPTDMHYPQFIFPCTRVPATAR